MQPRLKWNKIISAAKIILFDLRHVVWNGPGLFSDFSPKIYWVRVTKDIMDKHALALLAANHSRPWHFYYHKFELSWGQSYAVTRMRTEVQSINLRLPS